MVRGLGFGGTIEIGGGAGRRNSERRNSCKQAVRNSLGLGMLFFRVRDWSSLQARELAESPCITVESSLCSLEREKLDEGFVDVEVLEIQAERFLAS